MFVELERFVQFSLLTSFIPV